MDCVGHASDLGHLTHLVHTQNIGSARDGSTHCRCVAPLSSERIGLANNPPYKTLARGANESRGGQTSARLGKVADKSRKLAQQGEVLVQSLGKADAGVG